MLRGLLSVVLFVLGPTVVVAGGLLDGRAFSGMIGPAENPDLEDRLYFDQGHFWSEICTRCGFVPGAYLARETAQGIAFSGVLESDSRGTFTYQGLVASDGKISVTIDWRKERWYWTSERRIVFQGKALPQSVPADLEATLIRMGGLDPSANPACARF